MKRTLIPVAGLSCLALIVAGAPVRAMLPAPQPVILRVVNADLVVIGKVTGFGPRLVPAERFAGDKADYQIAVVKVEELLMGKGAKEIKVGFVPPPMEPPVPPKGPRIIRLGRVPQVSLSLGQEACLFLVKHPTKDFYLLNAYTDVVNKKDNPTFTKDRDDVLRAAKLLANPQAGLKSKNADDRLTTAALLINRYTTQRGPFNPMAKKEAINVAESKLILQALADAEWSKPGVRNWALEPRNLFYRLNVQPADGFVRPKDFRNADAEAQKWLKANVGKYRIQRFVPKPGS